VRLDGPSDRYVNGLEILAEVARQLAEVGIRAEVHPLPKADFFAERAARRSPFI
jgi:hypothetical protein